MAIKILIVEDEILIAEEISYDLESYGFEVLGIALSADECFCEIQKQLPDIIIMDINIKGAIDGISLGQLISEKQEIPLIYLTANTDSKHLEAAIKTKPYAFISKPYNKTDLIAAIELAIQKHNEKKLNSETQKTTDAIFVKHGEYFNRIFFDDINYIEADGSYAIIYTNDKSYTISYNLNYFQVNAKTMFLKRIHRSYIVNTKKIEAFDSTSVVINKKTLPISKSFQKEFLSYFNKL